MVNSESMKSIFESGLYSTKIGTLVVLIVLAFMNGHTGYISRNPQLFAYNSIIFPLSAAVATFFMAWNRHASDVGNKVLITFLFLFFFQVFTEMSGFYAYMGHDTQTQEEKDRISRAPLLTTGFLSLCIAVVMLVLAFNINQPYPVDARVSFPIETLIFVLLLTFGETTVTVNHGVTGPGGVSATLLLNIVFFVVTQVVLQKGGFYERVFKSTLKPNMY
jgi:hypothetical protein